MTKEQHVNYWVDTAQYDWKGAGHAFNGTKDFTSEQLEKAKEIRQCLIEMLQSE